MSINIASEPDTYSSVNNPVQFNVNSTFTNLDSIRYVVNPTGVSSSSAQQKPDIGTTATANIDIREVLVDDVSFQINTIGGAGAVDAPAAIQEYFVTFNSVTKNADGTLVGQADSQIGSTLYVINSALQHTDTQNLNTYLCNTTNGANAKFLTNAPTSKVVGVNDSEYLSVLTDTPGDADNFRIRKFDSAGNQITFIIQPTGLTSNRFDLGVGPANINALSAGFIDDDVSYYTIQVVDDVLGTNPSSEIRTFTIDRNCYEDPTRVHWLNTLGGIDSFTFTGTETITTGTRGTTFERYVGRGFDVKDRGFTQLSKHARDSYTARSGLLKQPVLTWLNELVTSPEVYVQDGVYIPVIIREGNFNKQVSQNIKRLDIRLDLANEKVIQRN
jgi:hypothetical protein